MGNTQAALGRLFLFLLLRGVEHEHASGRARLPRTVSLWKDEESEGPDALLLAELDLQVKQASVAQFDGQLHTETFEAVDSKGNYVMQLADLYTGAVVGPAWATGGASGRPRIRRHGRSC